VHIQRKREEELTDEDKVIVDVRTGKLDPSIGEKTQASEKWEPRPAGVWIKRSTKRSASDSKKVVTAVDVLFGIDAVEARPGWELVKPGALRLDNGGDNKDPRITIRRGRPQKIEKPVPRIRKDGKFKIMQISDLHLSTGPGVCRDPEPSGGQCDADLRTLDFVERLITDEKPDFVVLSGDQVNGDTAPDVQSVSVPLFSFFSIETCLSFCRQCSRLLRSSLSTNFHTQLSLAITMTRVPFHAIIKCHSTNPFLTPSPKPVAIQSRVWVTIILK